jgi:hypothetical protein
MIYSLLCATSLPLLFLSASERPFRSRENCDSAMWQKKRHQRLRECSNENLFMFKKRRNVLCKNYCSGLRNRGKILLENFKVQMISLTIRWMLNLLRDFVEK